MYCIVYRIATLFLFVFQDYNIFPYGGVFLGYFIPGSSIRMARILHIHGVQLRMNLVVNFFRISRFNLFMFWLCC